jgi:hypothetical protein
LTRAHFCPQFIRCFVCWQTHINARGVLVFTAVFPFPMFVLTCLFAAGRIMHQVCQVCVCLCLGGRCVCSFEKETGRHGNSFHSAACLPVRRQAGRQAGRQGRRRVSRQVSDAEACIACVRRVAPTQLLSTLLLSRCSCRAPYLLTGWTFSWAGGLHDRVRWARRGFYGVEHDSNECR